MMYNDVYVITPGGRFERASHTMMQFIRYSSLILSHGWMLDPIGKYTTPIILSNNNAIRFEGGRIGTFIEGFRDDSSSPR